MARSLKDKTEIWPYKGQLQTADGGRIVVEGRITTKLKLGEVDDDIEALVVPELRNQMVLGLRSMKKYKCCLNFGCDRLWTGLTKGSEAPVRSAIPKLVQRQLPTVPPGPRGKTEAKSITDPQLCERQIQGSSSFCGLIGEGPESSPGNYAKQCVRVVQEEDEKVQRDWETDEEDDTSEVYPEVVSLDEALRR